MKIAAVWRFCGFVSRALLHNFWQLSPNCCRMQQLLRIFMPAVFCEISVGTYRSRGSSQKTQSVTSSNLTSRWVVARSALFPAITMGMSCGARGSRISGSGHSERNKHPPPSPEIGVRTRRIAL